jgi:hypothetical protein
MEAHSETGLMFVSHPVAGVHRIPAVWFDGYAPSGFHPATAAEVRQWHEERGLTFPDTPEASPETGWDESAPPPDPTTPG